MNAGDDNTGANKSWNYTFMYKFLCKLLTLTGEFFWFAYWVTGYKNYGSRSMYRNAKCNIANELL